MNILLSIDGSPGYEDLVGEVAGQCWPAETRFTVLNVLEAGDDPHVAEQALTAAVFVLSERGWQATRHMREGDAKKAILDFAEAHPPDLIVVGARRRGNLSRFVLGSVSTAVVRHARCSVQIVRPKAHEYEAERSYRVLLATDGSPGAYRAVEAVAGRPWRPSTEVRVLSVLELIEPPTLTLLEPGDSEFPLRPEEYATAKLAAERAVALAARRVEKVCGKVTESVAVVPEGAKGAILDEAERWDADCIFVGSHGVTGLDRFLLGSVSEAVAVHAKCSVEVVR